MTIPAKNEMELPVLIEIESAGGELRPTTALFHKLDGYFSQLTNEDLKQTNRSGTNKWENRVHWTRLELVHKKQIDRSTYGIWRITADGRKRIAAEVGEFQEAKVTKESVHGKLQRQLEEIGRTLGKFARREWRDGAYTYDVVWKEAESLPRITHVFEVQDKGNVVEALVRLKHAYDNWGARLFLIVTGERDRARVDKLLHPFLSGAFHEISPFTVVLNPAEVEELHSTLTRHKDVIARFLAR